MSLPFKFLTTMIKPKILNPTYFFFLSFLFREYFHMDYATLTTLVKLEKENKDQKETKNKRAFINLRLNV